MPGSSNQSTTQGFALVQQPWQQRAPWGQQPGGNAQGGGWSPPGGQNNVQNAGSQSQQQQPWSGWSGGHPMPPGSSSQSSGPWGQANQPQPNQPPSGSPGMQFPPNTGPTGPTGITGMVGQLPTGINTISTDVTGAAQQPAQPNAQPPGLLASSSSGAGQPMPPGLPGMQFADGSQNQSQSWFGQPSVATPTGIMGMAPGAQPQLPPGATGPLPGLLAPNGSNTGQPQNMTRGMSSGTDQTAQQAPPGIMGLSPTASAGSPGMQLPPSTGFGMQLPPWMTMNGGYGG